MAANASLNSTILGYELVATAEQWNFTERCGQDLFIVVAANEDGKAVLPTHLGWLGHLIPHKDDLSFVLGVFHNNISNLPAIRAQFGDGVRILKGAMRGDTLLVHKFEGKK